MEWLVVVAALIGYFIYNGFRTRCPMCGAYALHPKDKAAEIKQAERYKMLKESGLGDALDSYGSHSGSAKNKPGYSNAIFSCKSCQHSFDRETSVIWLTESNKIGDEKSIEEYQKLKQK